MTIISMTGHRPEDLPNEQWVKDTLHETFVSLEPSCVIQGMAAGVDLWAGVVALKLNIPVVSAKPWAGHKPRNSDDYMYSWVARHSQEVVNVNDSVKYPGAWAYHNRNKYMVDKADVVVGVWTGKDSGGTYTCLEYARKQGKKIFIIDPVKKTTFWEKSENTDNDDSLFSV